MSNYTYEVENRNDKLETYEWDNVWWEHADTEGNARVLYIGDSISCATRRIATEVAEEKIFFDGFGTSKALDNPYFAESIRIFARQQGKREVVLFNNGLHGWHLNDEEEYANAYEQMIRFLMGEFENTPIMLLLTTHLADAQRDKRVVARNRVVMELARKYELPVVDLYSITKEHEDLISADGVHFSKEGYRLLACKLVERVKEYIK